MQNNFNVTLKRIFWAGICSLLISSMLGADDFEPKKFAPKPELSYYPCANCHDSLVTNPKRRILTKEHQDIEFKHAKENRWCLDCHDAKKRNFLRLSNDRLVPFEKSYLLCGGCHGTIYRDWKVGVHGKRTGYWNGDKVYRICVSCHNPHKPRFRPIKPKAPPVKPNEIKL